MPETDIYRIIFEGKTAQGQDIARTKSALQTLFRTDEDTVEKLFSGKRIILKKQLSLELAQKYQATLEKTGALCYIDPPVFVQEHPPEPNEPRIDLANLSSQDAREHHLTINDLQQAFTGKIGRNQIPGKLHAAIVGVSAGLASLIALYYGVIIAIAFGMYQHGIQNYHWVSAMPKALGMVLYAIPFLLGSIACLLLLKPLLAGRNKLAQHPNESLDRNQEPLLYLFVNLIADAVCAPRPQNIYLNCELTAEIKTNKSLAGPLSKDISLHLGMPLVAGLDTQQLAGMLAHNFAYYSKDNGMRFFNLSHKLMSWLYQSVHRQDNWDDKVQQQLEQETAHAIFWRVLNAGFWCTQMFSRAFLFLARTISDKTLQQMELYADSYIIKLSGSQNFEGTLLQLQKLHLAREYSLNQLLESWQQKILADDFPSLIANNLQSLPADLDLYLQNHRPGESHDIYSCSPPQQLRLDKASEHDNQGVFQLLQAARTLCKHYHALARRVSYNYYTCELQLKPQRNELIDTQVYIVEPFDNQLDRQALSRVFNTLIPDLGYPLQINAYKEDAQGWSELVELYHNSLELIERGSHRISSAQQDAEQSNTEQTRFIQALAVQRTGITPDPGRFKLNDKELLHLQKNLNQANDTMNKARERLSRYHHLYSKKVSLLLALLSHDELDMNEQEQLLARRNHLTVTLNKLAALTPTLEHYRESFIRLCAMPGAVAQAKEDPVIYQPHIDQLLTDSADATKHLLDQLDGIDHPLADPDEQLSLYEAIAQHLPKQAEQSELEYRINTSASILEQLSLLYQRVLSNVADLCLQVQKHLDCTPTPQEAGKFEAQSEAAEHNNDKQQNPATDQDPVSDTQAKSA